MHEYGLVEDVVELVLSRTAGVASARVASVRIDVGEFLVASRESLETAFEILTRGTRLEGCRLEVREVPGRAVCQACGFEGSGSDLGEELLEPPALLLCPTCAAPLLVTEGAGITLVDVQLHDGRTPYVPSPDSRSNEHGSVIRCQS